jgi:hypothetical protein
MQCRRREEALKLESVESIGTTTLNDVPPSAARRR